MKTAPFAAFVKAVLCKDKSAALAALKQHVGYTNLARAAYRKDARILLQSDILQLVWFTVDPLAGRLRVKTNYPCGSIAEEAAKASDALRDRTSRVSGLEVERGGSVYKRGKYRDELVERRPRLYVGMFYSPKVGGFEFTVGAWDADNENAFWGKGDSLESAFADGWRKLPA